MGVFAKSYSSVSALAKRWVEYRVSKNLDNRDFVLRDALKILEKRSIGVYPTILSIPTALRALSLGSAQTGLVITGVNLIGDGSKSIGKSSLGITNTEIVWTAVRPGLQTITLIFVHTGSLAVASVVGNVITVNINAGTSTASQIASTIAGHATAKFKIIGVANGSGAGTPAAQTTSIKGGTGTLTTMSIGARSIDDSAGFGITGYTDTAITFNFDAAAFVIGDRKNLLLTVDDVRVEPLPIDIVA